MSMLCDLSPSIVLNKLEFQGIRGSNSMLKTESIIGTKLKCQSRGWNKMELKGNMDKQGGNCYILSAQRQWEGVFPQICFMVIIFRDEIFIY